MLKTISNIVVWFDRTMNRWIKNVKWNKFFFWNLMNINAIAINWTFIAFNHFLIISMLIFEVKRWKNEKKFEFKTFCQQINCQSSYRESWIVRNQTFDFENNKQWIHQIMLFLNHSKKCSFKFLTQIDYRIREKYYETRKSRS